MVYEAMPVVKYWLVFRRNFCFHVQRPSRTGHRQRHKFSAKRW